MGTTNSQKSLLTKNFILLLVSFLLAGMIMKALSPPQKLDARFFYTYKEMVFFFKHLTPVQKTCYFYAELVDYWYMVAYSMILFVLFRRFVGSAWFVFIPGILDVMENSLIIYNLRTHRLLGLHEALPFISSSKWFIGFLLLGVLLLKFIRSFRKS